MDRNDDYYSIMKSVSIGRNCWIGDNVMICPGVEIGEGCVIGMGSVVTKSIPPLSVAGGNPCRVIKMRDSSHYKKLDDAQKYYIAAKKEQKLESRTYSLTSFLRPEGLRSPEMCGNGPFFLGRRDLS